MSEVKKSRTTKEEIDYGYYSEFPKRLRMLLEKTTQGELAAACNVARQSVAQWKDGNTKPDIYYLGKIADFFNVSTDYLLGRSDTKSADTDIKMICEYTGLDEEVIKQVNELKKLNPDVNQFINNIVLDYRIEELASSVRELDDKCVAIIERYDQMSVLYNASKFDELRELSLKYGMDGHTIDKINSGSDFEIVDKDSYVDLILFQIQKCFIDMVREFTHYDYFEQNIKR